MVGDAVSLIMCINTGDKLNTFSPRLLNLRSDLKVGISLKVYIQDLSEIEENDGQAACRFNGHYFEVNYW